MKDSLERIIPWELDDSDPTEASVLASHYQRYRMAASRVRGERVVDIACGVGYGSQLLLDEGGARSVIGVDVDDNAVELAQSRFAQEDLQFVCSSYEKFRPPDPFGVAVSLETIEHIPNPADFLVHLRRLVKRGGLLVGSVPVTPSVDFNPHHLHDFSERSIRRLLVDCGWQVVEWRTIVEAVSIGLALRVLLAPNGKVGKRQVRPGIIGFYLRHPKAAWRRLLSSLRYGLDVRYGVFVARALSPEEGGAGD